jgi:3-hydroxyisobutyrate dehydrogenase-like beta-hydroxyacid dehydrogenase
MQGTIGFIGLGIMGEPMARNLLTGGFGLSVFNRTTAKTSSLEQAGAAIASSPQAVAQAADTVILMLTGPEAVEAILWGGKGLLGKGARCRTIVNMSTVSPSYTRDLDRRLTRQGVTLIDAPVSGSRKPAEEGTLVILASGPKERVDALEPVLLAMGKKVVYCGAAGTGSGMKMFINLLLCTMISGLGESLTLGEKCGLSTETMLETVLAGPLGCGLFTMKADMFKTGEYPVQFPFKHMYKDLNFILETARDNGMNARIGQTIRTLYSEGMEKGFADLDFAAVKKVIEA